MLITANEFYPSLSLSLSLSLSHTHSNLVSKYEKGYSTLANLPRKAEGLEELFLSNSRPLVGEFTKTNQLRVYTHRPLLVAYLDVNWKPGESQSKKMCHNKHKLYSYIHGYKTYVYASNDSTVLVASV